MPPVRDGPKFRPIAHKSFFFFFEPIAHKLKWKGEGKNKVGAFKSNQFVELGYPSHLLHSS